MKVPATPAARSVGWLLRALAPAALLLPACAAAPDGPPQVRWGVDECTQCHMILGEERFAAVARSDAGEEVRFDDLGCLLRWLADHDVAKWRVWAHDAGGPEWLAASDAWYSVNVGLATPMGSGLRAWTPRSAAAAAGGDVRSWSELRATTRSPSS